MQHVRIENGRIRPNNLKHVVPSATATPQRGILEVQIGRLAVLDVVQTPGQWETISPSKQPERLKGDGVGGNCRIWGGKEARQSKGTLPVLSVRQSTRRRGCGLAVSAMWALCKMVWALSLPCVSHELHRDAASWKCRGCKHRFMLQSFYSGVPGSSRTDVSSNLLLSIV